MSEEKVCRTCRWWQPMTFRDEHRKHLEGVCVLSMYDGESLKPFVINTVEEEHHCYADLATTGDFGCNQWNGERRYLFEKVKEDGGPVSEAS